MKGCCISTSIPGKMGQELGQKSGNRCLSPVEQQGIYKYFKEEGVEKIHHQKNDDVHQKNDDVHQKNDEEKAQCKYCKRWKSKANIKRHTNTCKIGKDMKMMRVLNEKENRIRELEARLKEEREKLKEKDKRLKDKEETEQEYLEIIKKVAGKGGNTTYNQKNMFFIMKNYKDAHNYEALIEPELSNTEIKQIEDNTVQAGIYNFIEDRCIKNIDVEKRPFHCVDDSRNKFLLRTEDKWKVDKNANEIIDIARDKIKGLYNTDIERGMDIKNIYANVDKMGEIMDFEKKGRKNIIRELNRQTLVN